MMEADVTDSLVTNGIEARIKRRPDGDRTMVLQTSDNTVHLDENDVRVILGAAKPMEGGEEITLDGGNVVKKSATSPNTPESFDEVVIRNAGSGFGGVSVAIDDLEMLLDSDEPSAPSLEAQTRERDFVHRNDTVIETHGPDDTIVVIDLYNDILLKEEYDALVDDAAYEFHRLNGGELHVKYVGE